MEMKDLSPELLEKAKEAATVEELTTLAAESGIELTAEQAGAAFTRLHSNGCLADDELVNVSGGYVRTAVDPATGKPKGPC